MAKRIIKTYDQEFKSQAVKLAQEIGGHKAATELGLPDSTIYTWVKAFKEGRLEAKDAFILLPMPYLLTRNLLNLKSVLKNWTKRITILKK